jgi:predicted transcriptional regulator
MNNLAKIEEAHISPEGLEIANTYLKTTSVAETASSLGVTQDEVSKYLNQREVKKYVDTVYLDVGYRNRFKLAATLDDIIKKKLDELDEADMTSNKDIAELLQMAHKMRVDEMKIQTDTVKAEQSSIKHQTNVQINDNSTFGEGNYGELMKKLLVETG